ncbi:hypothetical protein [Chryseobacterium indologenes]|uniref:hypothetical protein n=1 Tax=Chryseobacterium indologenes TaxID=253 RepID=UPI0004AEF177|nr:hypothetical protein [Chryseobacterium indologenes]
MTKKKHIIDFPKGRGRYWYLFWIGKIKYDKQRKVDLYFYNKLMPDESWYNNIDYNNWVVKQVPVSFLSEYGIGSLYDVEEEKLLPTSQDNSYNFTIPDSYYMTQNKFPLIGNEYFIKNSSQIIDNSFKYLKVFGKNKFKKSRCILISPYTILQYLFFYNDKLINKAFSGELLSGFNTDNIKTYSGLGDDLGKKIGELHYDASKLTKQEAIILAPFFFIKDGKGTKFLWSIYSHVQESFFNNLKEKVSVYLNLSWEFKKYNLGVIGKEMYALDSEGKKVDYLLAYRITNFTFLDEQPYTVDEIRLFPFNAKNSTKDRENHDPIDVTRPSLSETEGLSLNLTKDTANNNPAGEVTNDKIRNPFYIPVNIIKREKQKEAYNVDLQKGDNENKDVIREIENLLEFSDTVKENVKNSIITIGNFEYFKEVIRILRENYLNESPNFDVKEFSKNEIPLPFQFVEISHLNKYIYFVEFGNGIIGVFNKELFLRISVENLFLLGSEFNDYENEIKETSKILWSYIRNHYSRDYIAKGIVIQLGAKHDRPRKDEGSITSREELITKAASRTAKKLYETRIVSNIL